MRSSLVDKGRAGRAFGLCIAFFTLFLSISGGATADSFDAAPLASVAAKAPEQRPAPVEACKPAPLIMPPKPAKIPGYAELDPSTGLHVTGTLQEIDALRYRLTVTGKVARRLSLTYDQLRCMRRIEARPSLVCPGYFTDTARWAGVPLKDVIDQANPEKGAKEIRLIGADNYTVSLPLNTAAADGNFLAYEWEGKALPALHGFPLRAVFPQLEGNQWVKWLMRMEVQ